ncbi:MAG TPA: hypothetical protein VLW05_08660, partial [Gaiellaceae bacterium]|nr:hypothetical protein [Gaiellaceae bacterium]
MARGAMAAVLALVLVSLVAAGAAGATARRGQAGASVAGSLTACLRRHGYQVSPETAAEVHTAPSRFDFVAVWNL